MCVQPSLHGLVKMKQSIQCPICNSQKVENGIFSHQREFFQCGDCEYIFLRPDLLPPPDAEKNRYLEHNNDLADPRYLKYLDKTWKQIESEVQNEATIVDFGCGPTKGLAELLKEKDFQVISYDPFFSPRDFSDLLGQVDVIYCSEAIEHMYQPAKVLDLWNQLLKPQGKVTLRTSFHPGKENMSDWWYANDETHIGFFNNKTFEVIANKWNWTLLKIHNPYVSAQKK